jgi:GNAT superfamily N-acetyltransferase
MERIDARLEAVERAAVVDFYRAAPAALAVAHKIEVLELDAGACVVVRTLDSRMFNRTLALGVAAPADDEVLDRISAFFGAALYVHAVAPTAQPPDLLERLERRGFEADYAWMRFSRAADADPPSAPTELEIRRVGSEAGASFARVVVAGYGLPAFMGEWLAALPGRAGWRCHLAYDGDRAAGAAALFIDGSTGWLGFAATLPELRGRGAQTALLAARIEDARAIDCDLLTTETGVRVEGRPSSSYRNLLRSGFREQYVRPNLRAPGG